jgi:hypothetical protein
MWIGYNDQMTYSDTLALIGFRDSKFCYIQVQSNLCRNMIQVLQNQQLDDLAKDIRAIKERLGMKEA